MEHTEKTKYRKLIDAVRDEDQDAFRTAFVDLFLEHIEQNIRRRAEALGYTYIPGATFQGADGSRTLLYKHMDD